MGLLSILVAASLAVSVGEISFEEAVLALCGASDIEELEQEQVEHFLQLQKHPVRINLDSRSKLLASGLFSSYQVASLCDAREQSGDILSVTELSALDGFMGTAVRAMALFIDFSTGASPGQSSLSGESYVDADVRTSYKLDKSLAYGVRAHAGIGPRTQISASLNHSYTDNGHNWTASVVQYGKKHLDKAVLGNFNLKAGQGLVLWTGMGFSGAGSPDSFIKNATFLGGTNSFSGTSTLLGGGTEWNFSGHLVTAACGVKDGRVLPVLNVTKICRTFQTGTTAFYNGDRLLVSADARACLGRTDIFCEAASNPAIIAGARFNFSYGNSLALSVRYYSPRYENPFACAMNTSSCTDERAVTSAWKYRKGIFNGFTTADLCCFTKKEYAYQAKLVSSATVNFTDFLLLNTRVSFRYRPLKETCRTDIRSDIVFDNTRLRVSARVNWLRCISNAFLISSEQGYRAKWLTLYLSEGVFHVDNWEDRIYAWQRDAPGTFSVPAFYGRGFWGSIFLRASFKRSKIYAKASTIRYADKQAESVSKRLPKTELKLQFTTSLGF